MQSLFSDTGMKKLINEVLVLITLLVGLMLTSCIPHVFSVASSGGGAGGGIRSVTYDLPALSTATIAITRATNENPHVAMVGAGAAYYRDYFGQGVTIAFIDDGMSLRADNKGHAAFGPDAETRIVNPVRISGVMSVVKTVTVSGNDEIVAALDFNNGKGQRGMGLAAGGNTSNRLWGIAISANVMPIDIGTRSDSSRTPDSRDGDIGTAFKYALDNHAKIISYGFTDSTQYNVTFSYNGSSYSGSFWNRAPVALRLTSMASVYAPLGEPVSLASAVASVVVGKDVAVVVGTGDNTQAIGWNSNGLLPSYGRISGSGQQSLVLSVTAFVSGVMIETIGSGTLFTLDVNQAASTFFGTSFLDAANMPDGYFAALPLIDQRLQSKFIMAAGVNNSSVIIGNGCGFGKHWCVSVPTGTGGAEPTGTGSNGAGSTNDTSHSAAIAAGALAVIQSRMPNLPVAAARAVMFRTATDLTVSATAPEEQLVGVDAVYGHGLVNLGAAISLVGQITLTAPVETSASGTTTSSQFLVNSSIALSPAFRSLQQQVSDISMAVDVLGNGFYFDTTFSSVLDTDALQKQDMTLGFAAQDMLSTNHQDIGGIGVQTNRQGNLANFGFRRKQGLLSYSLCAKCKNSVWDEYEMEYEPLPFFADTKRKLQGGWSLGDSIDTFVALGLNDDNQKDKYAQYGINWKGIQLGEWDLAGSFSRIQEQQGYLLGSEFSGAFSLGESSSTQVGLRAQRYIEGWRLFGGVEYGKTQVNTIDTSLVRSVDGLSYAGWRLGLDKDSVFRSKDKLHIGITRLPSVISGNMDILVSQATGKTAFDQDLQMDYLSEAELRKHKLDLEDSNAFVYRLGYSTNIHKHQRLALGFEHYTDKVNQDNTAFSAQYKFEF